MASGQTNNYELNQWSAEDPVLREEFNRDNKKVDEALAQKIQLERGTYTGNNTYGKDAPCRLEFSFSPQVVMIALASAANASNYVIFLRGQTRYAPLGSPGGTENGVCSWEETCVSWYSTTSASTQFNYSAEYSYLAIG